MITYTSAPAIVDDPEPCSCCGKPTNNQVDGVPKCRWCVFLNKQATVQSAAKAGGL